MVIQGYQYNLKRQLVPAEERHQQGTFVNSRLRFNLYTKNDKTLKGRVCLLPWQDGAVIMCSALFDPRIVFEHYFRSLKVSGVVLARGNEPESMAVLSSSDTRRALAMRLSPNVIQKMIIRHPLRLNERCKYELRTLNKLISVNEGKIFGRRGCGERGLSI